MYRIWSVLAICLHSGSLILACEGVKFQHVIVDESGPRNLHTKGSGDFNGDGFVDLLVAGTEGEIVWYEYPRWKKHAIAEGGGGWSTDAESGDIDQDGDVDIVISDWYQAGRLFWFENPGSSNRRWNQHLIGEPRAHDIELADFDLDGDLDIVTRQQGADGKLLEVWLQTASGSWQHQAISCPEGEGLTVFDLDQDGDLDIVIPSRWYETKQVVEIEWSAHPFTTAWQHAACAVQVGDMNADRRPDIVLVPAEKQGGRHRIAWYEAPRVTSEPDWIEHVVDESVETVLHSLGLADVNGDGQVDIVTAEMEQGADPDEVLVYAGGDQGRRWNKHVVAHTSSHSIRVIDVGNDGDFDIFGADWNRSSRVDLWENQAATSGGSHPALGGKWSYIELDDSRTERAFGLAFADLTGDSFADVASGKYFYRNPGGDLTSPWQRVTFPISVDALLCVDVDQDEFGDVIGLAETGKVYWLEAKDRHGESWTASVVGDVGRTDHDISSQGYTVGQIIPGSQPQIVINVGVIYSFEIPADPHDSWRRRTIAPRAYPEGVALGDVDGDGDNDLVGTLENNRVGWWENRGDGSSSWPHHLVGDLPDKYADRICAVDLNGNGRLDIAVSAANGEHNGIYWWEHPASTTESWTLHTVVKQATTNSLDVADMDDDGDLDLISGEHRGDERVAIWENDGRGQFVEHVVSRGRESHLGTRVHDFDNDGNLDILSIAWDDFRFLHLWRCPRE